MRPPTTYTSTVCKQVMYQSHQDMRQYESIGKLILEHAFVDIRLYAKCPERTWPEARNVDCTGRCVFMKTIGQAAYDSQDSEALTFSNFFRNRIYRIFFRYLRGQFPCFHPSIVRYFRFERRLMTRAAQPNNPVEISANDDGSGATFDPGFVVETLMLAAVKTGVSGL